MTTTAIKSRPIPFSAPMVRALLEGRKTQTRRIVKPQPDYVRDGAAYVQKYKDAGVSVPCPYGKPGDRLWVKETWQYHDWTEDGYPWIRYHADGSDKFCENIPDEWDERLQNIFAELSDPANYDIEKRASDRRWRPSIHMPRWASRITLEITDVRVERVQEISEEDAKAEGVIERNKMFRAHADAPDFLSARQAFSHLFYDINERAPRGSNPWVWVITFKRTKS